MANTFSQIYVQVVFAVQERASLIDATWREELFKYISGIVRNKNQKLLAIGGVADHIHLLLGIRPDMAISDIVREIKSSSSKFVNEKRLVKGTFYWQEGFGAFSYSRSQIDAVVKYILNQEAHHAGQSFKDEYIGLLDRFDIEYDDRYVFKWIGDD